MLVKYITTKSASFAKVSLFFDDNIRLRTKRPGNKSDELCLNEFHIPKSSSDNSTHSTTYKNLSYETCKPMVPLIEPYSDLEINKYSYFELMDFIKEKLPKNTLNQIFDTYLKILDSTRADIPLDLQDYWIKNQERLGLKGKFLPDVSNLIPHQKEKA
jgi:hypothetical protein